jgi:hypothetical protein
MGTLGIFKTLFINFRYYDVITTKLKTIVTGDRSRSTVTTNFKSKMIILFITKD